METAALPLTPEPIEPAAPSAARSRLTELRVGRVLVSAIALLTAAQVAWLLYAPADKQLGWLSIVVYGSVIGGAVLSLLLAWRRTAASGAFALAVFLGLFANVMSHVGLYTWAEHVHLPAPVLTTLDLILPASIVFMAAALVRFSVLFPQPIDPTLFPANARLRRVRVAVIAPRAAWMGATLLTVVAVATTLAYPAAIVVLRPMMLLMVLGVFILGATNLRLAYRAADAAGRRRMVWVLEGFLGAVILFSLGALLDLLQRIGGWHAHWLWLGVFVGFFLLVACLTIAMFFSGAFDPSLAIQRTAVYGVLGVLIVFIFVGVETVVNDHLREWIGLSESSSGIIIGGIVALTIEPIKERLGTYAEWLLVRWGVAPEPPKHNHH